MTLGPVFLSFLAGYVCGVSVSSAWLIRTVGVVLEREERLSLAYIAWAALGLFNVFALSVGAVAVITFVGYHGSVRGTMSVTNSIGVFSGVAFGLAMFAFLVYLVGRKSADPSG